MANIRELEDRMVGFDKQLGDMRDAIRRMSESINNLLDMLVKVHQDVADVKSDLMKTKNLIPPREKKNEGSRF